ncbi:MAG: hypothetical protein MJ110_01020 [Lachnospiraceae bacterium]|nr:hypothetical protein [Lachnospiraceae bacterium]
MKMRAIVLGMILLMTSSFFVGCGINFDQTCKMSDCEETNIYEDGYCKYHYYQNVGDTIVKDFFNN